MIPSFDGVLNADTIDELLGVAAAGVATAAAPGEAGEGEAGNHQNGDHQRCDQIQLISLLPPICNGQVAGTGCPGGAAAAAS